MSFTQYDPERPLEIVPRGEDRLTVKVHDPILDAMLELQAGVLVLSVGVSPRDDGREIAQLLKVPQTQDGFFLEAHMKLRPVDFATDGIYVCGLAHWPKPWDEVVAQACGAAGRAAVILSKPYLEAEGVVAVVNEQTCIGCGSCVDVCPYGAIELKEGGTHGLVASVHKGLCKGCGTCTGACPSASIQQLGFTDGQIVAMMRALAGGG